MRNLKRALSLALAAIMVMSLMVVGAGAVSIGDFSDSEKIVNKEAVTVLTTLGVINGKDDGAFDPQGIVTRAEMAKIICVALNGGQDPALGNATTHTYTDTIGHWAEAYIEYCTQLGIVAGKGNGTFDPNATVTGTEAAKMLLVALGYNAQYEGMVGGNWAIATNVLANQAKLYSGVTMNPNDGLTRDNAAQMAYNALNAEMVQYTFALVTGNNGSITSIPTVEKKSATLLSDKFGGVRVEGVVVRNEQTASNFEGKTRIDITNEDELAKLGHNFGDVATFETKTDASQLGTSVFFYAVPSVASPTNAEKAVVLGSVMDSGKNTVVSTTKTFGSDGITKYMKDNDIQVNANTALFVDGAQTGTGVNAVNALTNQTGCEVKFIDNDNDGVTEAVVQTNYSFGKVTKYSDKDDGTLTIDTYTDSKDYKSSKIIGFDDVALNDYVVYNHMGGKLYVAKAETVEGKLETYKYDSDRLKANLTVDGTAYTFSESANYNGKDGVLKNPYDFTDNSYMGKGITLYLDKFGFVAAVSDVQGFTDYAYISNAKVNNDASGFAGDVRVYATLADGTTASYLVKNLKTSTTDPGSKPTGVDTNIADGITAGQVGVGAVYGYYVSSDGQIELTEVTNGAALPGDTNNIEFSHGSSTITTTSSLSPNMTDNNTVFFYVMKEVNSSGVVQTTTKRVDTYVGKDNAPSIKVPMNANNANASVTTIPSRNNSNIAGAVVFQVAEVASANVLYLYKYEKSTNENTIYDAVIDGKLVEGITVDSKETNLAGSPYVYTMTSKGYYSVSAIATTSIISGYVTLAEGKSVVVTNPITGASVEVKITGDTSMAEIDGGDTSIISSVAKKDWVTAAYNPMSKDAMGIYLEERYSNDNTSVLAVDGTVVKASSTAGYKYDVAAGSTVGTVISDLALSKDATAKITLTQPTTLAEAKTIAGLSDATVVSGTAYIVVLSQDMTAYSTYKIQAAMLDPTADINFTMTTPVPDGNNTCVGGGAIKTVTVNVANNTASVVLDGTKTAAQTVAKGGMDASDVTIGGTDTAPTFTVDTTGIQAAGGSKTFTVTVSEADKGDITYTVTITVAAPAGKTLVIGNTGDYIVYLGNSQTPATESDSRVGKVVNVPGGTVTVAIQTSSGLTAGQYIKFNDKMYLVDENKCITVNVADLPETTTLATDLASPNQYVKYILGDGVSLAGSSYDSVTGFAPVGTTVTITVSSSNGTGVLISADGALTHATTGTALGKGIAAHGTFTPAGTETNIYMMPAAKILTQTSAGSATFDMQNPASDSITVDSDWVAVGQTVYITASAANKTITATGSGAPVLTEVVTPAPGTSGIYSFTMPVAGVKANAFTEQV